MPRRFFVSALCLHLSLAISFCVAQTTTAPEEKDVGEAPLANAQSTTESDDYFVDKCPANFKPIFDGESLEGWNGCPGKSVDEWQSPTPEQQAEWNADRDENWSVQDSAIVNNGSGVYLTTKKLYRDFELLVQYKTVPKADSGIYLRGTPQVQIWDHSNADVVPLGADKGSGGLWNNSPGTAGKDPLEFADNEFGEWNQFRIRLVGARCNVWLNGKQVVDNAIMENYWNRDEPMLPIGPIQLQTHGGEIQWRNLFVREFSAEESNEILTSSLGSDFRNIFNGNDLEGWAGAVEGYEIVGGAIQCKPGSGGTIYTEEKFSDFEVSLEFNLPEAGNNGLAIRYPGNGDPAYTGMCELQVLHNSAPMYDSIDDRQRHGSAYGMVAAKTGFLRETGHWNFQHIVVEGTTLYVELNGFPILKADLANVTEYLDDREHPGKDLKSGHFGFAGHQDPVRYRNVRIK